jgi:hypothetical protein
MFKHATIQRRMLSSQRKVKDGRKIFWIDPDIDPYAHASQGFLDQVIISYFFSVADEEPGSGAFLSPGSVIGFFWIPNP